MLTDNKNLLSRRELGLLIGQRLKEIRINRQLSQTNLSDSIGKSRGTIERIENGKVCPTYFTLYQICFKLEVDIELVIRGI